MPDTDALDVAARHAVDLLRSMWAVNAQLCRLEGKIGVLQPGAFGDVVISDVDPIENLTAFAKHRTALTHVIQNGRVVVDRTTR